MTLSFHVCVEESSREIGILLVIQSGYNAFNKTVGVPQKTPIVVNQSARADW